MITLYIPFFSISSPSRAPLEDATRAVGYLRHHAESYGLNRSAIGFAGFSAGGHLTAHISTQSDFHSRVYERIDASDDESSRPDFSIMVYPWYLIVNNSKDSRELSPELRSISNQSPPSCLFHASNDPTAPYMNSIQFFEMIHRVKNDDQVSRLEINGYGGHGFGLCSQFPDRTMQICSWLDRAAVWVHRLVSGLN